jgi:hypothetical protein
VELSARWRNLLSLVILLAMLGFAPLASTACAQPQADKSSPAAENEIRAATILFYAALNSAIHGDLNPLSAVWSHRPEVTNLNGLGGLALGWTEVRADFRNMARLYPAGQFATNIFQREDGKWKMIHHHADATTALSQ